MCTPSAAAGCRSVRHRCVCPSLPDVIFVVCDGFVLSAGWGPSFQGRKWPSNTPDGLWQFRGGSHFVEVQTLFEVSAKMFHWVSSHYLAPAICFSIRVPSAFSVVLLSPYSSPSHCTCRQGGKTCPKVCRARWVTQNHIVKFLFKCYCYILTYRGTLYHRSKLAPPKSSLKLCRHILPPLPARPILNPCFTGGKPVLLLKYLQQEVLHYDTSTTTTT
jgi:hypothetical protein